MPALSKDKAKLPKPAIYAAPFSLSGFPNPPTNNKRTQLLNTQQT